MKRLNMCIVMFTHPFDSFTGGNLFPILPGRFKIPSYYCTLHSNYTNLKMAYYVKKNLQTAETH